MNNLTLVIGNKNYSSWSLRAWLLLRQFRIQFREVRIPLDTPETPALMDAHSPNRRVPVLTIGELAVWDSLAIAETVNERFLEGRAWPRNPDLRAVGRSAVAEMHSGYPALRGAMPMNCRRRVRGFQPDAATAADIDRVCSVLSGLLKRSGGPWLLKDFSVADAFFAPVASRFTTYGTEVPAVVAAWMRHLAEQPAMREWQAAAEAETEVIEAEEVTDA